MEEQEFNRIYKKYKNLVLQAAYRYSHSWDLSNDIMQETFLALYKDMRKKNYTSASDYSNIVSWLYTTAKHSALNYNKKRNREAAEENPDEDSAILELSRESTEEEFMREYTEKQREELHERVMAGLMNKNPKWYKGVMLVCVLDMPQAEAAKNLGMSIDALYTMLYRARSWVRENYGVEYKELNRL